MSAPDVTPIHAAPVLPGGDLGSLSAGAAPLPQASADEWPADLPRPTGLSVHRPSPRHPRPYWHVRRDGKYVAGSPEPDALITKLETLGLPVVIPPSWLSVWPADLPRPKGLTRRPSKGGSLPLWVVRRGPERAAVAIAHDPHVLLARLAEWEATGQTRHRPPQPAPLRRRATATRVAPLPTPVRVVAPIEPRPLPEPVALQSPPKAVVSSRSPTGWTLAPNAIAARFGLTTRQLHNANLPRVGKRYDYKAACRHLRELAALGKAPQWWNPNAL